MQEEMSEGAVEHLTTEVQPELQAETEAEMP